MSVNVRGSDAHCRHSRDRSRRPDSRFAEQRANRLALSPAMLQQHPTAGLQILPSSRMICARSASPVACDQRRQRLKAHIAFGEMRVGGVDIGDC